jgi:hypothetical protein
MSKKHKHGKRKEPSKLTSFLKTLVVILSITLFFLLDGETSKKFLFNSSELLILVYLATFIGAVFEYKAWNEVILFLAKPLIKVGKLSPVSATSIITSIFSATAANTMISDSYKSASITRREMLTTALCNAYFTMVSHSLRIAAQLIALIGMAGVYYYSFTFLTGFIFILVVLLISRLFFYKNDVQDRGVCSKEVEVKERPKTWSKIIKTSNARSIRSVFRVMFVTLPIYLLVFYLIQIGYFNHFADELPSWLTHYLTPEMFSILTARLGGLISAGSVANSFLLLNTVSTKQIFIVFLIGFIVTLPIRVLRRNLPVLLGIFSFDDAIFIVMTMLLSRIIFSLLGIYFFI